MRDEPKFTPGPWLVGGDDGFSVPINAESELAFDLATVHHGGNDSEAKANARLIASAPDLYAACKAYLDFLDDPPKGTIFEGSFRANSIVKLMRSAVAKADGQTEEPGQS